MGYPVTTFCISDDQNFIGELKIVGDATHDWCNIVDHLHVLYPNATTINCYDMRGERFASCTFR